MTILTRNPNDSDEFPLGIGEERTVILRRDTTGEATRNLAPEIAGLPPRRRPAATGAYPALVAMPLGMNHHDMTRVIEIDETVIYRLPRVVDPETERLSLLGTVAGIDGDLRPAAPGPRPGPLPPNPPPAPKPSGYAGRRRDPQDRIAVAGQRQWELITEAAKPAGEPHRLRVQVGVGAFIAFAAAVTVVVLAVFW